MEFKSKKAVIEYFREQLGTKDSWALAGLSRIYSYQTATEQANETVVVHNDAGFTIYDAQFLSSLYSSYKRYGRLTDKQMIYLRRSMSKYARQLVDYSMSVGNLRKEGKVYLLAVSKK